jgi:dTDP-4-amino-4,6-dideoxygalactose transaminase
MKKLALRGGHPVITKDFPQWPIWDESDAKAVGDAVREEVWGIDGSMIEKFASSFSKFQRLAHVFPVANGSVALEIALQALGVGRGHEVIVPDYTFMATAVAPLRCGAELVLADVDRETFCLDPMKMQQAITERTKAIICVHIGGHPCDMTRIMDIANKYGIPVIEDCAHAHGAVWESTPVGSFGEICTFSFQSSKTLACGEGGAVGTNSSRLARLCWAWQNCGRVAGEADYNHYLPATNYRIGNLQAALLTTQLARLEEQCQVRDQNGAYLTGLLSKIPGVTPQARHAKVGRHGHYLFSFLVDPSMPRDVFRAALDKEGVPTQLQYPAIHSLDFVHAHGIRGIDFPVSTMVADRSVWLYHRALLGSREDTARIAEAVEKIVGAKDELRT